MNVVYIKTFYDKEKIKGYYIGVTNNFKKRMWEHEYNLNKGILKLPVYKAMKKYKHVTEIVFESNDYNMALKEEIRLISEYKEMASVHRFRVYNVANGGQGVVGVKRPKGDEHYNAKDKEYYAENCVSRSNFKKICKKRNWMFEDFEEIYSKKKYGSHKLYFYFYKPENRENKVLESKNSIILKYSKHPVVRKDFKKYCRNNNLEFDDFIELWRGDIIKSRKIYYYYHKSLISEKELYNMIDEYKNIIIEKVIYRYSNEPIRRETFKRYCKNNSLEFHDFEETFYKKDNYNLKQYFYNPKKDKYEKIISKISFGDYGDIFKLDKKEYFDLKYKNND